LLSLNHFTVPVWVGVVIGNILSVESECAAHACDAQ
jgi:hypothetical protein